MNRCRCTNASHKNHPGSPCALAATENDGYCNFCHDRAADEFIQAIPIVIHASDKFTLKDSINLDKQTEFYENNHWAIVLSAIIAVLSASMCKGIMKSWKSWSRARLKSLLAKLEKDSTPKERRLPIYDLSNAQCAYVKKGFAKDDKAFFKGVDGRRTFRQLVGYETMTRGKRFWHFGIQAKPFRYPYVAFVIKPHVIFSDDGQNIWDSRERMHTARWSQCKDWYNSEWRDRMLAAMNWLAGDQGSIKLPLGKDATIEVPNYPLMFKSQRVWFLEIQGTQDCLTFDFRQAYTCWFTPPRTFPSVRDPQNEWLVPPGYSQPLTQLLLAVGKH
jgi:hypothetical protein